MSEKCIKTIFVCVVTVFCGGIMSQGCVTSSHPGNSGLTLPYEGVISTDARAFTVVNNGNGNGIAAASFGKAGRGITGRANNMGDVVNYGGYFQAKGGAGTGVFGWASNDENVANYGGQFLANGLKGIGVHGEASARGDERNYGGFFKAAGRIGEGIHSEASGLKGIGVYAEAFGHEGIGVFGLARSTEVAINYGGYFWAQGEYGRGVYGEAIGDSGWGVFGVAHGEQGRAVFGEAHDDGDVKNFGGYFVARGKYGRGIYAQGGPSGYAAEFHGTVTTKVLEISGGADLSEIFDVRTSKNTELSAGMVVSIDVENSEKLVVSQKAYDRSVVGIISGAGNIDPGMILGQSESTTDSDSMIALTGRVYCLADTSNGVIQPGDLLTTSEFPGYAMKVTDYSKAQGAIIGKAMSTLKSGRGLVLVFVSLQ